MTLDIYLQRHGLQLQQSHHQTSAPISWPLHDSWTKPKNFESRSAVRRIQSENDQN